MSNSEEETYSIMFTSLKHPARRKILRMLAEKSKNFSRILEELGISSSHLTYHLENLGELLTKMDDGSYKLSTFGQAAVLTMKGVEEAPDIKPKSPLSLPLKWKSLFAVLMIGLIILAGVFYDQYASLNQISSEHEQLVEEFAQLSTDHDHLLSWGTSTERVVNFLEDVIQLDMTKYHATLERNTVEYRADLDGISEEILTYTLTADDSELGVDFRFRNQTLSSYHLDIIEGAPQYSQPKPSNVIDMADHLLQRYQTYAGVSYLETMRNMLSSVTKVEDMESVEGDVKLVILTAGKDTGIQWMLTTSGIDYQAKGVTLNFDNGSLEMLTDGWFLFQVGSTELDISREEALNIAITNVKDYTWTANGVEITGFNIIEAQATAELFPHTRDNTLGLIPYWYVNLPLDKMYPGNVASIAVGIWGDTGEITDYRTMSS